MTAAGLELPDTDVKSDVDVRLKLNPTIINYEMSFGQQSRHQKGRRIWTLTRGDSHVKSCSQAILIKLKNKI